MKDIAIYGAGGLGRETAVLLRYINKRTENPDERYNLIGFFDDGSPAGEQVSHFGQTLGGLEVANSWPTPLNIVIAIGSPKYLRKISQAITNPNISFPNIICPSFIISDPETFKIGRGNLIKGGCYVSTDNSIGDFNILNGDVLFGHDATMGNYNVFMPDVRISGNVNFGNENLIGVKALVIQGINIGNNVTIGAGAVLLTKPKDNATYLGNPAKIFKY